MTPAVAGEYLLDRRLAIGGSSTVYLAHHARSGRPAAVKVLHELYAHSPEMVERFQGEARAANLIRHPNIVDVLDLGALPDGRPYLVMELLEGESLEARLFESGPLALEAALPLFRPLGETLQAAHDAGVVHRDVKASNVFLLAAGRGVKLLDFGVAKLLRPDDVGPGLTGRRMIGTPSAMSPEQVRGWPVDHRADLYALGVLLFQVLTGRLPFESTDVYELEKLHVEAPPPRPSAYAPVAPHVEAAILKALEKEPARRHASATAFLAAVSGF